MNVIVIGLGVRVRVRLVTFALDCISVVLFVSPWS